MASTIVKAIPLSTFNAAALLAGYQALNTGLDEACFLIIINNDSNTDVTISYDGVTDHDYISSNETKSISSQTNAQPNAYAALFAKHMPVYVKGVAGVGTITLSGYYV